MKILYAAGNTTSSLFQLARFSNHFNTNDTIKIAAYKKSSPKNLSIDWTLDFLLNPFKKDLLSLNDNENCSIYFNLIKSYKPDLIISDLEIFTSLIGIDLNIPVIQCSSSLLSFALEFKYLYHIGMNKYNYLFLNEHENSRLLNIILNSNANYVYSHFGDIENSPNLKFGFNWISPYHSLGKISTIYEHEIVGINNCNDLNIINLISGTDDCVLFSKETNSKFENIQIKNIEEEKEYSCNVANAKKIICEANSTFLADAFYNNKKPIYSNHPFEYDVVLNGLCSSYLKTAYSIDEAKETCNFNLKNCVRKNPYLHEIL